MPTTFIVIGGGCYGSHHLARLERGRARGAIAADARVLIVDRNPACQVRRELAERPNSRVEIVQSDWLAFLQAELDRRPATDEVVPAPIAPHLAAEWLLWSLQSRAGSALVAQTPFVDAFGGLPYEYLSPSGERFFSAAGWVCPPNCRAPKKCPAILAPRTWDLEDTVRDFSGARSRAIPGAGGLPHHLSHHRHRNHPCGTLSGKLGTGCWRWRTAARRQAKT